MKTLEKLKQHLKQGEVYRRADLVKWTNTPDRHLKQLVDDGTLEKLSQGLYHLPKKTVFGNKPPEDEELVRTFLKDDDFLLTSPNVYNRLGVGTTQLYNETIVYNHKRHGQITLANRQYSFRMQHRFPKKLTQEFLLVDLLNNLDSLAEDTQFVLTRALDKAKTMNSKNLAKAARNYGKVRTKKLLLSDV